MPTLSSPAKRSLSQEFEIELQASGLVIPGPNGWLELGPGMACEHDQSVERDALARTQTVSRAVLPASFYRDQSPGGQGAPGPSLPPQLEMWHFCALAVLEQRREAAARELEEKTKSLSTASLRDLWKLLTEGRTPQRTQDAGRERVRVAELHEEMHNLVAILRRAAPLAFVLRHGKQIIGDAVRKALRGRSRRPRRPRASRLLRVAAAANAALGSAIMRHGPPLLPPIHVRPGAS